MTNSNARVAFVMDPMEGINPGTDTSFALMQEAWRLGLETLHVAPQNMTLRGLDLTLRGYRVLPPTESSDDNGSRVFVMGDECSAPAEDFGAIFVRTDPPFDQDYLNSTWLLSFAARRGVRVVNDPRGIRNANEKLYAQEFAEICPRTVVTADVREVQRFLDEVSGEAVAKPLDGFGGFGVMRLRWGDSNVRAIVEVLTAAGKRPILVQEYLPDASAGDRRLFMLNGELRAVLQRTPAKDDHRGNVHVGGTTSATEITQRDRAIAEVVGPRLREDGLLFVGLDVIDGKLIEINVTSPTLVQELRRHGGPDLAQAIMHAALKT